MLTHVLYKQDNHNNYYICNINLYNKYTLNNNINYIKTHHCCIFLLRLQ